MLLAVVGAAIIVTTFVDAFITIVLPKTVSRGARPTQLFYTLWGKAARGVGKRLGDEAKEAFLGVVWPLSTIALIALWVASLVLGFALLQYGLESPMSGDSQTFGTMLYVSATTFFTLGYGDVTATTGPGRLVAMFEAGTGFAFLGLVIGFVPVFYQSFSARERTELLLDARAGSPPMAGELLRGQGNDLVGLRELFAEFERWAAMLLEGFLSYQVLAYYRSQHAQLSWLACLTCVTDACSFVMAAYPERNEEERALRHQAAMTYAISRHLAVDLSYAIGIAPLQYAGRLSEQEVQRLYEELSKHGLALRPCPDTWSKLRELTAQYDPYYAGLARHLLLEIPAWMPLEERKAGWQKSAWDSRDHF